MKPVGNLDIAEPGEIAGWAVDPARPERPAEIEILSDSRVIARLTVDRPRPDVSAQGLGPERCGFHVVVPPEHQACEEVSVRLTGTGRHLPGSPRLFHARIDNIIDRLVGRDEVGQTAFFQDPDLCIVDDFLPAALFEQVQAYAHRTRFEYLNARVHEWDVWRLHDGSPLKSVQNVTYRWPGAAAGRDADTYPTGSPLDFVAGMLARSAGEGGGPSDIVGLGGRDWQEISGTVFGYPVGAGLSVHLDGRSYTGAYTYYLSEEWDVHWGGLLLAFDPVAGPAEKRPSEAGQERRDLFSTLSESRRLMASGPARCIVPKPNRMVFIGPRTPHMITRVDPAAGDRVRLAVSGFFQKSPVDPTA